MALGNLRNKSRYVYCKTTFIALHKWDKAPDEVKFLRDAHRHVFHVKVTVIVTHDDRAVEFITMRKELDGCISNWALDLGGKSCEMIADMIAKAMHDMYYRVIEVDVSEDGENGATCYYERVDSEQDVATGSDKNS